MADTSGTITATCRCGQVKITVQGPPAVTNACHCTGCQAMTSSAFSLGVMYHGDAVTIEGETVMGGLKGDASQHHCCANCLSWVFTRAEGFAPFINIHSAMLGDLARQPPFIEVWTDEKLDWVETGAAHSFAQFPPPGDMPGLLQEFARSRG
ncbi:Uncharacterized conserved protein [Paracoccus isoporae]|uniref:Uncharacterized conserved protein n=1 Tax=Paracoccus isoporae TaxID=591205 RepID=A0A1G7BH28_9RHOB|nr:GFA family protein [Paracoccus isoporae]SDE26050.1 Uncharacterized conserved protein [Paracoccus isoporae]